MGLEKLIEIAKRNPLELNNPIVVVNGRPITLREAIQILQAGGPLAERVKEELHKLGIDPPQVTLSEEAWQLALARWKAKPKTFAIYFRGKLWTRDEIIKEIEKRSEIGAYFAMLELGYLQSLIK